MRVITPRQPRPMMRLAVWLATTSLSLGMVLPAMAQPAAPPGADLAGQENTDPPPIAGSLAAISGTVSFHAAGETTWSAATLNYPVTNGEGFWTEAHASATVDIADDMLVLDESTEFDVVTLDQSQFSSTLAQGAIFIQLNSVAEGQTLSVNTPRGTVTIKQPGRYEIVAGDTNDATLVTVVEGAAHVSATGMDLDIGPQQTASIGGTDTFQGTVGPMQQDAFLQDHLRVATATRTTAPVPRQVQYMTGGAELASYGSFTQTQQYGQVWYPNDVASDWAPYRDGHWAYVQPWGWTWVDNARWGFAPFHYGRWVQVDNRWGWVAGGDSRAYSEGAYQYPVYSPALVSFVGVTAGLGIGFSIGAGGYAPAWIPLGPREPYYPWYHVRDDYFARMNQPYGVPRDIIARGPSYYTNIHNTTVINNTTIRQTFINERAATVIPAEAFARGEGVMRAGRPLPPQAFATARPLVGRLPVRPTAFTPNLSPVAARRFNVEIPQHPVRPVAAGPRIVQAAPGARVVPELRRAALPQNIHAVPANQVRPQAGPGQERPGLPGGRPAAGPENTIRPGVQPVRPNAGPPAAGPDARHGLPQLRTPGARPEAVPARPGELARPGEPARPGEREAPGGRTPVAGPGTASGRPELRTPGAVPSGREAHPAEVRRPGAPYEPKPPGAPHVDAPREANRPEAPRAAEHAAPRPEGPRPEAHRAEAPRAEAPRPAPHAEAPRPAPHVEAPRPAPHMEAPRPAPRAEAPHPAAPHPAPPQHGDDKKPH